MAEHDSHAPDLQDGEDVAPGLWPPEGQLARAWEAELSIRDGLRKREHFTDWPVGATGVQSVKAMGLNPRALEVLATQWCPIVPYAKSVPIAFMRQEAWYANHLTLKAWSNPYPLSNGNDSYYILLLFNSNKNHCYGLKNLMLFVEFEVEVCWCRFGCGRFIG